MGCIYCGKEIGPLQQLRDDEFCSPVHRKTYSERLWKGISLLSAPDPVPSAAGFAEMQGRGGDDPGIVTPHRR